MLLSFGSFLYGYVAPAPVNVTPASLASSTTLFAHPGRTSTDTKYPPFGLSHEIRPLPPSSFSNVLRTVSNLGFKQSAKICICFLTPSAFLKNCT